MKVRSRSRIFFNTACVSFSHDISWLLTKGSGQCTGWCFPRELGEVCSVHNGNSAVAHRVLLVQVGNMSRGVLGLGVARDEVFFSRIIQS